MRIDLLGPFKQYARELCGRLMAHVGAPANLKHVVVASTFVLASVSASAEVTLLSLLAGDEVDWAQRSNRLAAVSAVEALVKPLYNAVPNLSPEQEVWLRQERLRISSLDQGNARSDQTVAFAESYEFRLESAKHGLSRHLSATDCIKTKPALEFTCWTHLANELLDTGTYEAILFLSTEHSVRFPEGQPFRIYTQRSASGPDYFPKQYARGILANIVAPHLNRLEAR
jgi:hypothetical protein